MAKGVLEVLERMASTASLAYTDGGDCSRRNREAISLIAELISADVEYDEAMKAACICQTADNHERLNSAKQRRAAALAACRGL